VKVVEDAPEVIGYIEGRLKIRISPPSQAFGYLTDDGQAIAGIVINDYTGSNCELTIVAERGRITRGVLRHIASHVFHKLGCRRATIRTRKSNKELLRIVPRFGFVFESVAKHYYPDSDAVVFRMLRRDCKWIAT
jgi:RimJ/RimL family protein N-acetyltransferase